MPPSPPGPGSIAIVHRVTIATALLGAIAFTAWAIAQRNLAMVAGGGAATVVVALYLRNLRSRLAAKLTPRPRG